MTTEIDLTPLSVTPTPEALEAHVTRVLQALAPRVKPKSIQSAFAEPPHVTAEMTDAGKAMFMITVQTVLKWISSGDTDHIAEFRERLPDVIQAHSLYPWLLYDLASHARLSVSLQVLHDYLRIFDTSASVSKVLTALMGARRGAWRDALQVIGALERPVRAKDLLEHRIFRTDNTAKNALSHLADLGTITLVGDSKGTKSYQITWTGMKVLQVLKENAEAIEHSANEDLLVEEVLKEAVPDSQHFSRQVMKQVGLDPKNLARAAAGLTVPSGGYAFR